MLAPLAVSAQGNNECAPPSLARWISLSLDCIRPDPRPSLLTPRSQAGIDGSGQVLGCGDSGVDVDNCYFYDANVPFTVALSPYGVVSARRTPHQGGRIGS